MHLKNIFNMIMSHAVNSDNQCMLLLNCFTKQIVYNIPICTEATGY